MLTRFIAFTLAAITVTSCFATEVAWDEQEVPAAPAFAPSIAERTLLVLVPPAPAFDPSEAVVVPPAPAFDPLAASSLPPAVDDSEYDVRRAVWDDIDELANQRQRKAIAENVPENQLEAVRDALELTRQLKHSPTKITPKTRKFLKRLASPIANNADIALAGENNPLASPILRKAKVSRRTIMDLKEAGIVATTQSMRKSVAQTMDEFSLFLNLVNSQLAQKAFEATNLQRFSGKTRGQVALQLQTLRQNGTRGIFKPYLNWLRELGASAVSRSDLNAYFLQNMQHMFECVVREGINFYYNPADIDWTLTDLLGRTNAERMRSGFNPLYINKKGRTRFYDWHHLAQDQRLGSIIVMIPHSVHKKPEIHPFNDEGSQIDRRDFGALKLLVNRDISVGSASV